MAEAKSAQKKKKSLFHRIINVFLGILIGILVLIVIAVGFTQTKTFREILRKEVLSQVNARMNGRLYIDKIEGTIFTSLTLRNVLITLDKDTVVNAEKIAVKASPIEILFKRIHVREFELANARINLLKDTSGNLNIANLMKPTTEDTVKSQFPFTIDIDAFKINNASLKYATYENKAGYRTYTSLNMDDLRMDSLYLDMSAFADIKGREFQLHLIGARFKANLESFRLLSLQGKMDLTDYYARINDFYFKTNLSDFNLNAALERANLFDDFSMSKLRNSPVRLDLIVRVFDFSDLTSFASAMDMMKGTVKTNLNLDGTFGDMRISRLSMDYLQTHLEATGEIKNMDDPENLFINAHLSNSTLNEPDIASLLPGLDIPVYKGLKLSNIVLDYEGKTTNFKTTFQTDFPQGSVNAVAELDFSGEKMKYNVDLKTRNLNLSPVIESPTNITMAGTIKGEGTEPKNLNAQGQIVFYNSSYSEYDVDSLNINLVASNGQAIMRMITASRKANIRLDGNMDFTDEENPSYNFTGRVSNLNLEHFVRDTSLNSNLNLTFNAKGRGFEPDRLESSLRLQLSPSHFRGISIDTTNLAVDFTQPRNNYRELRVNSDFAEMNVTGRYSLATLPDLLTYESGILIGSIMQKVYEFNPWAIVNDSARIAAYEAGKKLSQKIPPVINTDVDLDFDLRIKDFNLIALFAGVESIDMDGKLTGSIQNDSKNFKTSAGIDMNYLKLLTGTDVLYVSNFGLNVDVGRANDNVSFNGITASVRVKTDRIFSGTDIKNIDVGVSLDSSLLHYSFAAGMDTTIKSFLAGQADMTTDEFKFIVDDFLIDYLGYAWVNDSSWVATYTKESFNIEHLSIAREDAKIHIQGSLFSDGREDLTLRVENLNTDLVNKLSGLQDGAVSADLDMQMKLGGYLHDPIINLALDINDMQASNIKLGFLRAKIDYAKKLLTTDVNFLDSTMNTERPTLTLKGNVPVDLAFVGAEERMVKNQQMNISLKSQDFELGTFGSLIPFVSNLRGRLFSDLNIAGTSDALNYSGNLGLRDLYFVLQQNNLPYIFNLNLGLAQEAVTLESFSLKNAGSTPHTGTLEGSGRINFDGTSLKNIDISINGDLAVLSNASRGAMPYAYGNLVLASDGNWRFTYDNGLSNFDGTVLLRNTDLTIPQSQTSYGGGKGYVYKYMTDTSIVDHKQEEFKQVVALSRRYSPINKPGAKGTTAKNTQESDFNYNVRIRIDEVMKLNVILNKELNQLLTAELEGDLLLRKGGLAQGEFRLLEDSKLEFLKTFSAEGSVFFESDITNPRLDITATYIGDHNDTTTTGTPEQVAVKIKLQGPLQELGQYLANNQDQVISVYVGESNIENNTPSPQYNNADAISFIATGKFVEELTATDRNNAGSAWQDQLQGYGTSMLGSLLSGFANSQLGDAIKNVALEQRGNQTRVSVMGKISGIRYSFGSTTEGVQDISRANISVEYPVNQNFLIRFQRKDPIIQTIGINDKINELALRYKFIF